MENETSRPRRKRSSASRGRTTRRVCTFRRQRFRHEMGGGALPASSLRRGDAVRFCSRWRPDYVPGGAAACGIVLNATLWWVRVAFNDFPDEPLWLGLNEVRRVTGTRRGKAPRKRNRSTEWNSKEN